jgi:hypothetical protein
MTIMQTQKIRSGSGSGGNIRFMQKLQIRIELSKDFTPVKIPPHPSRVKEILN